MADAVNSEAQNAHPNVEPQSHSRWSFLNKFKDKVNDFRGRYSVNPGGMHTASAEQALTPSLFRVNETENRRAKAEVINPEALKIWSPVKRFIAKHLVRKDEAVVSLTGQPEQLVNFILQAQQHPLAPLETGENQPQNLPEHSISLQRTGIYLIVPDPYAEKRDHVERLQPQNAGDSSRLLIEVVGIKETGDSYAVAVLYPSVSATRVLDLGDVGRVTRTVKGKAEDSPNYRTLKRLEAHRREGVLSTLDFMRLNPFLILSLIARLTWQLEREQSLKIPNMRIHHRGNGKKC